MTRYIHQGGEELISINKIPILIRKKYYKEGHIKVTVIGKKLAPRDDTTDTKKRKISFIDIYIKDRDHTKEKLEKGLLAKYSDENLKPEDIEYSAVFL